MTFEQHQRQFSVDEQVNVKNRAEESGAQLNWLDLQNGSRNWGHYALGENGLADRHLPNLSIYNDGDGVHLNAAASPTDVIRGSGAIENNSAPLAASAQSGEAGISTAAPTTVGNEGNTLQNISSKLQTDFSSLTNAMDQFTKDLTSAETGLAQTIDSIRNSSGPSLEQQLQSLQSYLGILSENNSSPKSSVDILRPGSDTTLSTSAIINPGGGQPPSAANANQLTDSSTATLPADSSTATLPADNGGYNVINGKIIGPNGKAFDAIGVAVGSSTAQADAANILQAMPNLNFIRLAAYPATDTPADIQADIQAFQNINPNVVVEVQDATSNGGDTSTTNTLTGQALTNDENWYAQIAANNVNNPNVWFNTPNEPNDASTPQNVVDEETGIYNAVRGTGNNSMVVLESDLGALYGPMQADPGAYSTMTNAAWSLHYYGWPTQGDADGGQSVPENVQAIQSLMAGQAGITESNGTGGQQAIPMIIDEYGNATSGTALDANGTAAVDAVQTANNEGLVQGAVAWAWDQWNPPGDANAITTSEAPNTLTPYGEEIVNYVNSGVTGVAE